tara:strand:- start:1291 stop:1425 length:135 start_codon:yes stop_codon:yes gene_type:complete
MLKLIVGVFMHYVDLLPVIFVAGVFVVLIGNLIVDYLNTARARF